MIGDLEQGGILSAQIDAAVGMLSQGRSFDLVTYSKFTNPADGYVYWLKTDKIERVAGSLHNSANQDQSADETISRNTIIFTTMEQIKAFDSIDPDEIRVLSVTFDDPALVDTGPLLIGFNIANNFYEQAGAYHYVGQAVYPQFRAFFVDDPDDFTASLVAVNSLPIMLSLGDYLDVPIYAAYAVPANLEGPYLCVDIHASTPLQAMPGFYEDNTGAQTIWHVEQFKRDQIELTGYNLTAVQAQKVAFQLGYLSDRLGTYGLATSAAFSETDRVQSEYHLRANKKTMRLSVNYWTSTAQAQLRNRINSASYTMEVI